MKIYLVLIFIGCIVALSKGDWVRVWEDNFDWNGGVDLNKWDFDEGGGGWGLLFILFDFFLQLVFLKRR
jgi:hypothetical protein